MEELSNSTNEFLKSKFLLESIPMGIIVFDSSGNIMSVTDNFFRFGVSKFENEESLLNQNVKEIELFRTISVKDDIVDLGQGYGFEKTIVSQQTLDGGQLTVQVKGAPIYKEDVYSGGILIVEDAKVSFVPKKTSAFSDSNIEQLLSKLSDGFLIIDQNGMVKKIFDSSELHISNILSCKTGDPISSILSEELHSKISNQLDNFSEWKNKTLKESFLSEETILSISSFFLSSGSGDTPDLAILFKKVSSEGSSSFSKDAELEELRNYQMIATSVFDAIVNVDLAGNITFWNKSAEQLLGAQRSAVFGKFIGKILPIFTEAYFKELLEELKQNKVWESRLKIGTAEKVEFINIKLSYVEENSDPRIVIFCTNITKQINLERRLRQSEERFRDIVTNTKEYICTIDLDGTISYVNPFFINEFGYEEGKFVGRRFTELIENKYFEEHGFDLKLFDSREVHNIELPLVKRDGSVTYVMGSFSIVADLNDRPKYYNAILTDISSQKETEKDLLLIKSVFEASNEGIAVASKRKLVLVNETFVKMFGYDNAEDLIGRDPLDMVDNSSIPEVAKKIEELESNLNKPQLYEFLALRKGEGTFYAENSSISYKADDKVNVVYIVRDITEEKRSQMALKESENRYRSITENISESLWTAERSRERLELVFYTSGIEQITGYTVIEFLENKRLGYKIIHPNDLRSVFIKFKKLFRDSVKDMEEIEYRIINKDGSIVWIKNKVNVVRGANGEIDKVFGLISDISLSKRAEEELTKSTDNLKKLNDTKDKFISIISHDLRTPFSSIIGFAEIMQSDPNMELEKREQYLKFILESSKSMLSLVNSLLDWTRLQTGRLTFEPKRVNAKTIINNSYQMISGAALKKNIQILNDVIYDVFIHADTELLLQVFNNLLSNAIKFTDSGGKIIIGAYPKIEARVIEFRVKDDGVGIKKDDVNKLFKVDSKFTLAGTAGEKGSGLGLSLCYDIVQKHGGDIWVESVFGEGTEFVFTIPISSTKILLVDDMKTDKILYSKLIKSILPNHTVETADNGKEAFEMIKVSQPALVITDHLMPVLNGYELIEKINRDEMSFKPPVIVLSSGITPGIEQDYKELGVQYVFNKPVDLSKFKHALEESLKKAIFN
ncbi:MAG: PAS domain S-box protein [Bacteroidetes bacterium]|nr:PAS domain S-box protein [Bacteroidota bacterium]